MIPKTPTGIERTGKKWKLTREMSGKKPPLIPTGQKNGNNYKLIAVEKNFLSAIFYEFHLQLDKIL